MTTIQSNISIHAETQQALNKIKELNQAVSLFNRSVNQQNAEAMKSAKTLEKQVLGLNFANKFDTQIIRMSSSVEQFSQKLDRGKLSFGEYRKLLHKDTDLLQKTAERRVKLMQSMQVAMTGQMQGGRRGALITPQEYDKGLPSATSNIAAFGKQLEISTQKTVLLNEAMRQGAIQITNWGKNMQWAGRQLTVGLTLPITAFAAVAVKSFSEVEEQLIQIRRVYGDLGSTDFEKMLGEKQLTEAAEAWSKYGVSLQDALKVGSQVAASGATGAEAVSQMNQAIRFATLGNFDLAESHQAVTAMMSSMGIASEDLRKEIDYLNAVENQTLLTMEDVAEAVPRVGPVLKDMGGDVRDLTTFLAAMKEGGVDASEGANALKSGLASLINPTKEARENFKNFGIDLNSIVQTNRGDPVALIQGLSKQLAGLSDLTQQRLIEDLFGKYQFARWSALFDNINKAGSQAQQTLELAGMSAADLAQIATDELGKIEESPLTKFNKNLEELKQALIPIGEMVLKVLNPFIDGIGNLIAAISGNDIAKWAIGFGGAFIAIVGPITMFMGLIANLMGNLMQFRAFMRKRATGATFMTELEIQGKLAAQALDEFNNEAMSGLSVLGSQSRAVQDLSIEYLKLADAIQVAATKASATPIPLGGAHRPGVAGAATTARGYGRRRKMATGGTVPGAGSGDKVPVMLEPGEFVVSKDAAKKYGPHLAAMNAGTLEGMKVGTKISGAHMTKERTMTGEEALTFNLGTKTLNVIEDLIQLVGKGGVTVRLFGKSDFPLSQSANVRLRNAQQGVPVEEYRQEVLGPRAAARQQYATKMIPGIAPGAMAKLDEAIIKKVAAAGKQKITDIDVDKALVELAKSSDVAEAEVSELAKEIINLGTQIKKAEVSLSDVGQSKLNKQYSALQSGEAASVATTSGRPITVRKNIRNAMVRLVRPGSQGWRSGTGRENVPAGSMVDTPSSIAMRMANQSVDQLEESTETKSPSKAARRVGEDVGEGYEQGLERSIPEVEQAAARLGKAGIPPGGSIADVYAGGGARRGSAVRQAEYTARRRGGVAAAAGSQPKVAEEAEKAAGGLSDVDGASKKSADAIKEETKQRRSGISGMTKTAALFDTLLLPLSMAGGAVGDFANKLFIASSALTAFSMIKDFGGGGGIGGVGGGLKGAKAGIAAGQAKNVANAAKTAGNVSKVGKVAGAARVGVGAVAGSIGIGAGAALAAGAVAVIAAAAFGFWKLNKHMNKFDKSLVTSTDTLKGLAETFGYEYKAPSAARISVGSGASSEQAKEVTTQIDEQYKSFVDYVKDQKSDSQKQTLIMSKVAELLASGMPVELAAEFAKQFAQQGGGNVNTAVNSVKSLTDAEGNLAEDYGKQMHDMIMGPYAAVNKSLEKALDRNTDETEKNTNGMPTANDFLQKELTNAGTTNPYGQAAGQYDLPDKKGADVLEGKAKQMLESLANAAGGSAASLTTLMQAGQVSADQYAKSMRDIGSVVDQWGNDKVSKNFRKALEEMVPGIEMYSAALDEMNSKQLASMTAGAQLGIDWGPLLTATLEVDGNVTVDNLGEYTDAIMNYYTSTVLPEVERRKAAPQAELDTATAEKTRLENIQKGLETDLSDAQDYVESIADTYEKRLIPLRDRAFDLETVIDNLGEQKDLLQDQLDIEEKKIDAIDEEIDKIDEARQADIDRINESAEAQIAALQTVQAANERSLSERSAFGQISSSLQQGDVAGALLAQGEYSSQFAADSVQNQIDQVEQWKEDSIDAIDREADAKIDAEKAKQAEIQITVDAIQGQINQLESQIKANSRLKDSIDDNIRAIGHQQEIEQRAAEDKVKRIQAEIGETAILVTKQQEIINNKNTEIAAITASGQEVAKQIGIIASDMGIGVKDLGKITTGENLSKMLDTKKGNEVTLKVGAEEYNVKMHTGGKVDKRGATDPNLKADEVPATLQVGEFVIRKKAVEKYGANRFALLNDGLPAEFHEGGPVTSSGFSNITSTIGKGVYSEINDRVGQRLVNFMQKIKEKIGTQLQPTGEVPGDIFATGTGQLADIPELKGWWWPTPGHEQNADDFGASRDGGRRRHAGWDIGLPNGTPVYAMKPGTVFRVGRSGKMPGAGVWAALSHGGDLFTRYLHMKDFVVQQGDVVKGGQLIGHADSTGTPIPHLHFEITRSPQISNFGQSINPSRYFELKNPYTKHAQVMHEGGVVGSDEVPTILQKGEFVIPKNKWSFDSSNMSMPSYDSSNMSMPSYDTGGGAQYMPQTSGGGGGGGSSQGGSVSSSGGGGGSGSIANNSYTININVGSSNASPQAIANIVQSRMNMNNRRQTI